MNTLKNLIVLEKFEISSRINLGRSDNSRTLSYRGSQSTTDIIPKLRKTRYRFRKDKIQIPAYMNTETEHREGLVFFLAQH